MAAGRRVATKFFRLVTESGSTGTTGAGVSVNRIKKPPPATA